MVRSMPFRPVPLDPGATVSYPDGCRFLIKKRSCSQTFFSESIEMAKGSFLFV
jgi:hypothetical protein